MGSFVRIAMAAGLALAVGLAQALEIRPFSPQALEQAQRADAPLALHFHSNWCATCKLQSRAFESLRSQPGLGLTLLVVDFDEDRQTSRAFRVTVPGALIVLRGTVERARLQGVVDSRQLRDALRAAL